MTTVIEANNDVITQINVFTVHPEDQQRLIDHLVHFNETIVRNLSGYVGSIIHKSLDGHYIANLSQWTSLEALNAAHRNPEFQASSGFSTSLALRGEPDVYQIVFEHQAH